MTDKVSVIRHAPKSRFIVIYHDYMQVCSELGILPTDCAAAILRVFERWTDNKLAQNKAESEKAALYAAHNQPYERGDSTWIWLTRNALITDELFSIFGERSVGTALKGLQTDQLLLSRNNPTHAWDRTIQYKLNVPLVQSLLDALENGVSVREVHKAYMQNAPIVRRKARQSKDAESGEQYHSSPSQEPLQENSVAPTGSTPAPLSTTAENRTAALRDYGHRVAEHIEALPPVGIDDFGKTDLAGGYAVTPPPSRTEPLEEVKTALAELFGWKHEGVLHNYGRMLRGIKSKRKTSYDEYAFVGAPVSADELRAFVASWKRAHPGLDLPQTPDAMARHVSAYRAAVTNTAPGGSDDPFSRFTIE